MRVNRGVAVLLLLAGLTMSLPSPAQETIVVDSGGNGDFRDIQGAIDSARGGDTVLVTPGEYLIAEPIDFNRLHVPENPASPEVKNITVRAVADPEATVIRMSEPVKDPSRWSVVVFENGETRESVLEGFTLTGGRGIGECNTPISVCSIPGRGGGVFCSDSSPTISRCVISGNLAVSADTGDEGAGGGVYCAGDASPMLMGCTISGNTAGGAVGGGVYCSGGASPILSGCRIIGNSARTGGGVFCGSQVTLINCLITGNTALGGVCDFRGRCWGGGIFCAADASALISSCTISGNRAGDGGGIFTDGLLTATNSVVWSNSGGSIYNFSGSSTTEVSHSCIETAGDDVWPGTGNINADPRFVRPGRFEDNGTTTPFDDVWKSGDYHMRAESPCIDAGTPEGAPPTDLDGNDRPCGETIDMGAYEFCGPAAALFIRGDVNVDGQVDISDALSYLYGFFLSLEPFPCQDSADADDNGAIELTDAIRILNVLFLGFGSIPEPGFLSCGVDPTDDGLDCRSFPGCG